MAREPRAIVSQLNPLTQIVTCCLIESSHYMEQLLPLISEFLWYSHESNFTVSTEAPILYNECVSKIRRIFSVIHYTICGAKCYQFTHFFVMIARICILCLITIIKSEVCTITNCLGLGHETMVFTVCLSVFLYFYDYYYIAQDQMS